MFGGTLALKGALEEQRAGRPAHCEDGCVGCEFEAAFIFQQWLLRGDWPSTIVRKEKHSDLPLCEFNPTPRVP